MLTDRLKAGTYGYIDYKKKKLTIMSAGIAVFVIAILLTGYLIYGTVKNIISLPALLLVIPFANFFSTLMALIKLKSPSLDQYNMLGNYADMLLSDLIIVDKNGGRFYCELAVIHASGVCAYSSAVTKDKYKPEVHINELLKKRGLASTFKIYNDFDQFLKAVNGKKPVEDERRLELIKETITLTCM